MDCLDHVWKQREGLFKRMYSMDINNFNQLLHRSINIIKIGDQEIAACSSHTSFFAEIRLGMTLSYLAGGQVWDIRSYFGVYTCEFYRSVWKVVDATNNEFPIDFDITDEHNLKYLEKWFANKSRQQVIRGAVGAIDGCLIWQKSPGSSVDYSNR